MIQNHLLCDREWALDHCGRIVLYCKWHIVQQMCFELLTVVTTVKPIIGRLLDVVVSTE